ncbi:MAG TPA: choice-of-anchor D domain-containing protein, partial [Bryobacteraceae bacterium]
MFSLLGGSSYAQLTNAPRDFGSVAVGSISSPVLLVYHFAKLGVAPAISLKGSADFSISGTVNCSDPNNCIVPVRFAPRAPGLREASVIVKDGLSNELLATMPLVGNGVGPEASLLPGVLSTIVGSGPPSGYGVPSNGSASQVRMRTPGSIAFDREGNLFVADGQSNMVLKYTAGTEKIAIVAGTGRAGYSGDGQPAIDATLNAPSGVAVDSVGNLYIADAGNNVIRVVDGNSRVISTIAGGGSNYGVDGLGDGGPARNASLSSPSAVIVDRQGNVYLSDTGNNVVRKIDLSGTISIVTGSYPGATAASGSDGLGDGGAAAAAVLNKPAGLALDLSGAHLYVADTNDNLVRVVDLTKKQIAVFAGSPGAPAGFHGDGSRATMATLNNPEAVAVDPAGNVYIADSKNHVVRRVDALTGMITTLAGVGDGPGYASNAIANIVPLNLPYGLALDSLGSLYVADYANSVVQKITMNGTSYNFPETPVGQVSSRIAQPLTVVNTGNADLTISGFEIGSNFVEVPSSGGHDCSRPMTLPPGGSCQISFAFAPARAGNASAVLQLHDDSMNDSGASQTVSMSGTGVAAGVKNAMMQGSMNAGLGSFGAASPGPLSSPIIDFGNQAQWTSAPTQSITFSNPDSITDTIASISITGTNQSDFHQTNTCSGSLAPGGSCTISVTFTPSTGGSESGSLVIQTADSGSPYSIALSGNGVSANWP